VLGLKTTITFLEAHQTSVAVVPEGSNEGSQAIYYLERIHEKIRPVGNGMIWAALRPLTPERKRTVSRRSDRPYGTGGPRNRGL
jgi:hypothetical protein